MPTYIRKLTPQGLEGVDYTAETLNGAAQHEPSDGIYTVTNTYQTTKVLKFDAHLDRMEDSARRANVNLKLDRRRLRSHLRRLIEDGGFGDVRFRVTVPRDTPDTFIITLEPYTPPSDNLVNEGVRVITAPNSARNNPGAKTTDWMHERKRLTEAMPAGIYDTILLDAAGNMLEGLAANFYAILDGELRTAGTGVLPGIAQQIVLEVALGMLPVVRVAPNIADVSRIAEAFITSSSRGIIPVVEIDGQKLGEGTPGYWTRRLREAYIRWAEEHLEEL
jgi:branched-chain amino acid aminotransferase